MMLDRHGHVGIHTSHSMQQSPVVVLGTDLDFWETNFSFIHLFYFYFYFLYLFSLDSQKGRKKKEENTN